MKRRALHVIILGVIAALVLAAYMLLSTATDDRGSPELAQEWKEVLEPLATPEVAVRNNPDIQVARLRNGDWAFGLCRDSHGPRNRGGGTLVVKDSQAKTRVFFGHVCGPRYIEMGCSGAASLDEFYKLLASHSLTEQEP